MTTQLDPTHPDTHRADLADLLDRDPAALPDDARLVDDLGLDSLAMMTVLTWLDTRGVVISNRNALTTVGDVLSMLDRPRVSVLMADGSPGPTGLPTLPRPVPPADPLVPVLETAAFRLRPVQQGDLTALYTLATHPQTAFRWRYRSVQPTMDTFARELWTGVLVQYVVRPARGDDAVGLVVAYSPAEEHACLGAVFDPAHTGSGLAAQAVMAFARYLFHSFPLRKLYLEIPEFNMPQLHSGAGRLFQVEGVLREHCYYAGRWWDQHVAAIYPDGA
jgi:RimJ/RimL family protein N-acetyltransferase/aryl carrier-like protein